MAGTPRDYGRAAMTWLTAGALVTNLLLVIGLVGLIAVYGLGHFWQSDVWSFRLEDGSRMIGEIDEREPVPGEEGFRIKVKVGNRDLTGADFRWVDEQRIVDRSRPPEMVLLERVEWGNFYGLPVELRDAGDVVATGADAVWKRLLDVYAEASRERAAVAAIEDGRIVDLNWETEQRERRLRRLRLEGGGEAEATRIEAELRELSRQYEQLVSEVIARRRALESDVVVVETADGVEKEIEVARITRALRPNQIGVAARAGLYASRLWEFLSDDPRESNTEGGVFPAIFGTVMMVVLMAMIGVPFGVLAAVYLREYAHDGFVTRTVRIAVNNLAGVPSIVFGVFGLGFFVYFVGGSLDRLFFAADLPTPTFGTGGILWASLTLALLTVPVVIVATEEGLAAVPRVVREGSLALGATKFETLRRVVLPAALPGILTGTILAMARAAGEVAPLMLVGVVKLAPSLPVDHRFPFVHLERKFMHLGFHVFDLGFQSPNVEAVKPLVFATSLLLVVVLVATNLAAIVLRNRLRRRYASSAV